MNDILCAQTQEFVYKLENICFIGVTNVLINKLGNITSVDLPSVGEFYSKGEIFGFLESQNAASELFMPVSGTILAVNEKIIAEPQNLNNKDIKSAWLIKISDEFYNADKNDLVCYNENM